MSELQKFAALTAVNIVWAVVLMTVPSMPFVWIVAITTFVLALLVYAFFGVARDTPWRQWAPHAAACLVLFAFIYWLGAQPQLHWPGYLLGSAAALLLAALFVAIAYAVLPDDAPSPLKSLRQIAIDQGLPLPAVTPQSVPAPDVPKVDKPRIPTMREATLFQLIMLFEFPGCSGIGSEIIHDSPLAVATVAKVSILQDLQRRMSFNVIEIPLNANAENAALHVLGKIPQLRESLTTEVDRNYEDKSRVVGERFAFSDKIFIYHEPSLTEDQRKRIWNQYKAAGYIVEFRGPEYIADLKKRHGAR